MSTIFFADAIEGDKEVGSKALHLMKMKKQGFPIPNGFVIRTDAFKQFIEENEIDWQGQHVKENIMKGHMPQAIEKELIDAFHETQAYFDAVAVRSSSGAEDLAGGSFAGQYETFLNVKTEQELTEKVKACWASAFAARVQQYSEQMKVDLGQFSMGVVVQGLVKSEVSGVIFSQNPVTNHPDELMINASYGLGEAIVSGLVTPDTYTVNKFTFHANKQKGFKEMKIVSDSEGTKEIETTEEEQNQFCLSDDEIKTLTELTQRIEGFYGYPVDLEFAIQQGHVYILQARPITTVPKTNNDLSAFQKSIELTREDRKQFWLLLDTAFPEVASPLFTSFLSAFTDGMNKASTDLKSPNRPQMKAKVYRHHVYTQPVMKRKPSQNQIQEHQAMMKDLYPSLTKRMYRMFEETLFPMYKRIDDHTHRELTLNEARSFMDELEDIYAKAYYLHFDIVMPQLALISELEDMYENLTGQPGQHVHDLLTGVMNKSLETDSRLGQLALQVRENPELHKIFNGHDALQLEKVLNETKTGKAFLDDVQTFLNGYGYRTTKAHDFIGETWVENPLYALGLIQNFVNDHYDFDKAFQHLTEQRKQKFDRVMEEAVDGELKETFRQYYAWGLDASVIRDDHHFYIDEMLDAKCRLFLLKVGELLRDHYVISDREDIFYLYLDELKKLLENPANATSKIAARKQAYTKDEQAVVPQYFGTPPKGKGQEIEKYAGPIGTDESNNDRTIGGLPASSGTYSGTVKVIKRIDEFSKLKKGEILVCKTTTPTWTILFQNAKAVITDSGGILSHAAIIAREFHIPAVVGVQVATKTLKDGDVVTVNGNNGVVTIENE
ncbi:pyruvate,water dikinase [Scopulibacillus darangshiensis]|uniref:Pyruvate,water dikinase n=1 Tax=Scopulibacillus darangshiensis TaxID=442528 RepID=A0A4R2NE00_9BACL|nr:PEP/pyruvate-binding domain-containing protein [Scopulibacillus darangshiensis]TCP19305.1 pyruvate,water dikinase [Scopulibacillus darangshiensis]